MCNKKPHRKQTWNECESSCTWFTTYSTLGFAPVVKIMTKVRRVARSRRPLVAVAGLVLFVYMGVMHRKGQRAKSDKTQKNDCKGRLYSMSEELSRSVQLPVKSLVCRHHWDQIWRENARCSCPSEEHSECLHQHLIPARLYVVFDSVGAPQMLDRKFKRLRMRTRFVAVSMYPLVLGWGTSSTSWKE